MKLLDVRIFERIIPPATLFEYLEALAFIVSPFDTLETFELAIWGALDPPTSTLNFSV